MIIKSILDTDLYKFTTSYAYMKLFPQARGTFELCSTCIRNRVKDGVGIKPFVRDDVYEIIKQYKLYV